MSNSILSDIKHCMHVVGYDKNIEDFSYDEAIKVAMNSLIYETTYQRKVEIIACLKDILDNREKYEKKLNKYKDLYNETLVNVEPLQKMADENANKTYIVTNALGEKDGIHIFSKEFQDCVLVPVVCDKKHVKLTDESKLSLLKNGNKQLIIDEHKNILCEIYVNEYQEVELDCNKLVLDVYNNPKSHLLEYYPKPYLESLMKNMVPNEKYVVAKCLINHLDEPKHRNMSIITNYSNWMDEEFMVLISIAAVRA